MMMIVMKKMMMMMMMIEELKNVIHISTTAEIESLSEKLQKLLGEYQLPTTP